MSYASLENFTMKVTVTDEISSRVLFAYFQRVIMCCFLDLKFCSGSHMPKFKAKMSWNIGWILQESQIDFRIEDLPGQVVDRISIN